MSCFDFANEYEDKLFLVQDELYENGDVYLDVTEFIPNLPSYMKNMRLMVANNVKIDDFEIPPEYRTLILDNIASFLENPSLATWAPKSGESCIIVTFNDNERIRYDLNAGMNKINRST